MKFFLYSLRLLAVAPVLAQLPPPSLLPRLLPSSTDKEVYEVVPQTKPGEMNLLFLTPSDCLAREEALSRQQHESKAQLAQRKANIPPGGYLQAFWIRASVARASADKFEFSVTAPGNRQLLCYRAKPTAPHRSAAHGLAASYSQVVLIPLPKLPPPSVTVAVEEAATGEKFLFLLLTVKQPPEAGTVTETKQ